MPTTDKRIDDYINKANDFAKPILKKIRKQIHVGCPDVTETIKWGMPIFEYHGILCNMAAFKMHCAFGFWKAKLLIDKHGLIESGEKTAMGIFGKITSVNDFPPDAIFLDYVKQAMELNEKNVKLPAKPRSTEKKKLSFLKISQKH